MLNEMQAEPDVLNTYFETLRDLFEEEIPRIGWELVHLPVETMGLEQLAKGADLDKAKFSGCRFVGSLPDGTVIACEMSNAAMYGKAKFRSITRGKVAEQVLARVHRARDLAAVKERNYEMRLLTTPGLLEFLHLRSQDGSDDLLLPILSAYPKLKKKPVLTEKQFLAIAQPIAAERLKFKARKSNRLSS